MNIKHRFVPAKFERLISVTTEISNNDIVEVTFAIDNGGSITIPASHLEYKSMTIDNKDKSVTILITELFLTQNGLYHHVIWDPK
uniref:Uncharacterized protein n=1 Tax=viral metagenome TaxID=1070528 RepID=A0A6M3L2Q2_9ZZZZ